MKRFKIASIFLSLLLSFTFCVKAMASSNNALVILDSTNINSIQQVRNSIKEREGRITHIYSPHILIGYIPKDIVQELVGEKEIVAIHYGLVDPSSVEKYGKTAVYAVEAWNNNFMGLETQKGLTPKLGAPEPPPIKEDALTPRDEHLQPELQGKGFLSNLFKAEQLSGAPFGATLRDTSEYMIGDIAVGIILMESNGNIDTNTEDWISAEETNVISEVQAAMSWWAAREPNANLTFTYDINYQMATDYEPINRPGPSVPGNGQDLWIPEAMTALGYTTYSSYFDNVHDYNGAIRDANNADWGFTIFVIDSSNDADGLFADGYFAYAYLGGPFMVMTYKNNGYGIANMDAVTAHEMGHIFYALDEYASAGNSCTDRTGYLNIENQNNDSTPSCDIDEACIMRGQVTPYSNGNVCTYTKGQIGWRDTDGDGIQDIVDTFPNTTLNAYSPDPTTDDTPTYTGSATVVPYTNSNPYGNGNDITINTLTNVEYRVDSGSWTATTASDGAFDEATEDFTFTSPALADGTHIFETRTTNSVGNIESSYASDSLSIHTQAPNDPSGLAATAISSSQINLSWTDNSNNETGFKIERKIGAGGTWGEIYVGTTVDETAYNDTGLSESITYYYRVRAYNGIGDSNYSNEANATTQAATSGGSGGSGGGGGGGGGGCFIATAVYGSPMHPYVKALREFRDKHLSNNFYGRKFVGFYYKTSPAMAEVIRDSEFLKAITRVILTPLVMFVVYPYVSLTVFIVLLMSAGITLRLVLRNRRNQSI